MRQKASSLCVNLHLAESLNLTLDERKVLAKAAVEVTAGRVPVIVHVSTPGTDQAIELAQHAEKIGADCVMAIAPYYLDPMYVANEGKLVAAVPPEHADAVLSAMKNNPYGSGSVIIGEAAAAPPGKVLIKTLIGGTRIVDMLSGEQLPRIC